jgi:nucleoside-diphosphate-sugar epimerase
MVHGLDISRAIIAVLEAPRDAIHNEVFNVGDTEHNYRIREIAEIVVEVFAGCKVSFGPPNPDNRSYRVSFDKIRRQLPGFRCEWDARRGARQLHELFARIDLTPALFEARPFTRLKQLEYLVRTGQIDGSFFWRE